MKRKILLFLTMFLMCLCLVGCKAVNTEEKEVVRAEEMNTNNGESISIWTDEETGVQYIIFQAYRKGGITPRLNADGSLFVEEGGLND